MLYLNLISPFSNTQKKKKKSNISDSDRKRNRKMLLTLKEEYLLKNFFCFFENMLGNTIIITQ